MGAHHIHPRGARRGESVKSAVPAEIDFSLSLVLQVWDERMDILYAVNGIDNTHSLRYWARSAALRPVVNLARIGHRCSLEMSHALITQTIRLHCVQAHLLTAHAGPASARWASSGRSQTAVERCQSTRYVSALPARATRLRSPHVAHGNFCAIISCGRV